MSRAIQHCTVVVLAATLAFALPVRAQPQPVVVAGGAAAPALGTMGTGLCISNAQSTNPGGDFGPLTAVTYNAGVNSFMEAHASDRVTYVQRTILDLSNNNTQGLMLSYGDFTNSMTSCQMGGCDFWRNDTTTSFASRLRGYINIGPALAGRALHFGFYADDAVSMTIWDRAATPYNVVTRPPVLGAPTWRTTNSVTFTQPGLYPIEILYVEIVEHAALEMSILDGAFVDYELPANQVGSTPLKSAGFQLALASMFFLTENGRPAFANPDKCQQCNRQFANLPGNGDCGNGSGYYCNAAALCAPCDSAVYCGPACSPCGKSQPFCVNLSAQYQCVECRDDMDCKGNFKCDAVTKSCVECKCPEGQRCNDQGDCLPCDAPSTCGPTCMQCPPETPLCVPDGAGFTCAACLTDKDCKTGLVCTEMHTCMPCNADKDCERGKVCEAHQCQPCSTQSACAGASCNCCPAGKKCAALTQDALPTCVECTKDADCGAEVGQTVVCDTVNGRCVAKPAACNTSDRCGLNCAKCPKDRPFCIAGEACAECRSDVDCGDGRFCLSGECTLCATDRRCGPRCASCGGDTPYCRGDGTPEHSTCARCRDDAQCPGGRCQPGGTCSASCTVTCPAGLYCFGNRCVTCYASTQCPCGQTCDPATQRCAPVCQDNGDCQGNESCMPGENPQDVRGTTPARACKTSTTKPADAAPCCGVAGPRERSAMRRGGLSLGYVALALLGIAGLAFARARRRRRWR